MNSSSFWIYLLILAGSTYLIRAVPFAAVKNKITNPFIRSFLYYIPFTVLAAMTFPSAIFATGNVTTAIVGLLCAAIMALMGKSLTTVALTASASAFLAGVVISII